MPSFRFEPRINFPTPDNVPAKSAKELEVYQLAYDLAMRIFRLSKTFPAEERYALTSQIRRSSRSVPMNLREAWLRPVEESEGLRPVEESEGLRPVEAPSEGLRAVDYGATLSEGLRPIEE